jgi:3-methyladenine DNA glycosylase AlkD
MKRIKGGRGGIIVQAEKGETANPNGRPRKTINSVNKELEAQGIKPTTANEIKDIYLRLVNMEMTELKALVENQKQPALIRIVGKKILSDKGFDIIEKMLDRSIGRATQQINVNDITPVIEVTDQQKKAIDNL